MGHYPPEKVVHHISGPGTLELDLVVPQRSKEVELGQVGLGNVRELLKGRAHVISVNDNFKFL